LQTETIDLVTKGSIILHKYLRQNSAAELPFIIDGIANIKSVERRKTISGSWLLQILDTANNDNLRFITALTTEKLHVLYVIGIQNTSDPGFVTF
jgi:predicted molibdopterin-dependent oxidoreductase YjgC